MMRRFDTKDPGFEAAFSAYLAENRETLEELRASVSAIIADVRTRGDEAVAEYTRRFDKTEVDADSLRLPDAEIEAAVRECPREVQEALSLAKARIEAFYKRQMPQDLRYTDEAGVHLGVKWSPLDAVGLYVPGGKAAYPSSVLMNAIPARVAGVERLAMVVPTPEGVLNPAVMAAARLAGINEIYRIGGAQAVAALAYGTQSLHAVDAVVGPGNAYVAEAKRQVYGRVGIDMIAGPSEILVVADSSMPARWAAADLLSQAEHDASARAMLITDSPELARAVEEAVEEILKTLPREKIARASWQDHGAVILVPDRDKAPALINRIAPEHLELAVEDPEALLPHIRHAGAIFLGKYTPEAIGDYTAGPSHVLPTDATARFSSGLSVYDFLKRSSLIGCSETAFRALSAPTATLADAEGLHAHALSVRMRGNEEA